MLVLWMVRNIQQWGSILMVTIVPHLTNLKEQIKNTVWWLKEHLVMRQRRMFLYILAERKLEQLDLLELRCRSSLLILK